jgi:hypothetical protein
VKAIQITSALAALAIAMPCASAFADHDGAHVAPAAKLLYLDQTGWEHTSREAKTALAVDFMRAFCGNPAMPAVNLVDCLDRSGGAGPIFEHALACIATVPSSR